MRLVTTVALALAVGIAAAQTVHSQQQPTPLHIGFVDVRQVLAEYRKCQTVAQERDKRKGEIVKELKQRSNAIEQKKDKLATLAEEGDDFIKLAREIDV